MIDIRRLLSGLTQAIGAAGDPDAALLASTLDIDLSEARVTKMKSAMAVVDARLNDSGVAVDIIWGISPRREIWIVVKQSAIPYRTIKTKFLAPISGCSRQNIAPVLRCCSKSAAGRAAIPHRRPTAISMRSFARN